VFFIMSDPIRLSKRLIEQLSCSRREAELYIQGGWVLVDGEVVEEPQFKVLEQKVELHPEATLAPRAAATLLLHALPDTDLGTPGPALLSADARWAGDASEIRILKAHYFGLTHAAPMQSAASGLVVFTQDWRVLRRLTEDAVKNEHEYIVEVSGSLSPAGLALLNHGLYFNDCALPPIKVSWQNETRLRFALKNPRPGLIAHMCESVGLTLIGMKRIRIGALAMGKLPAGQWRYMAPLEKF
jgi:23S rRNA pseudouridine2604 synthase